MSEPNKSQVDPERVREVLEALDGIRFRSDKKREPVSDTYKFEPSETPGDPNALP